MVYVCKEHLLKGVQTIKVPHINKVSSTKFLCDFCGKQVHYKLFAPIFKKQQKFPQPMTS